MVASSGAIADPIGVGGESPRGHKNAWELDGKNEEKVASSPA